jgi:hypothetical protein
MAFTIIAFPIGWLVNRVDTPNKPLISKWYQTAPYMFFNQKVSLISTTISDILDTIVPMMFPMSW